MAKPKSVVLLFVLLASSCAATARQTESVLAAPPEIPEAQEIQNISFIRQSDNYCGPATLTMAMNWAGKNISVQQVADEVYTAGKKGSLQMDLIGSSRRQGLVAIPIQGMNALLQEVAAGHPVIILENLAFSWFPRWHYALVTGYDLKVPEVIMHSGADRSKHWSMRKFERSWVYGNYWGLVVLPLTKLAASADDLAHATAAAALEQLGKNAEAEIVYANILKKWPASLPALIGMGNTTFARGDFAAATAFLRVATQRFKNSAVAWHNRAIAEGAARRKSAARSSAQKAIRLAEPDTQSFYRESLKEYLPKKI